MKWNKLTIETTTAAEDMLSYELSEMGMEGVEIEELAQDLLRRQTDRLEQSRHRHLAPHGHPVSRSARLFR